MKAKSLIGLVLFTFIISSFSFATTYIVSVAPSGMGDPAYSPSPSNTACAGAGSTNTVAPTGTYVGSFAWAIASANCNPGKDTITFSLSANTILKVGNPNWYVFSDPAGVVVDATIGGMNALWVTAGSCKPIIGLDGNGNGYSPVTLSSNCTIRGIVFYGFQNPVLINNVTNCAVYGCYFGLDITGTALNITGSPQKAVYINGASAKNNIIGGTACKDRNIFGMGYSSGVEIDGGASLNAVTGNYFGTDKTGLSVLSNSSGTQGVYIHNSSPSNTIKSNVIVGYTKGAITTGQAFGIQISSSNYNYIDGNYVGVNANGVCTTCGNAYGIETDGTSIRTHITNNVVSGNGRWGINCNNTGTADSLIITGNIVGLNSTGVYDASNTYSNAISTGDYGVAGVSIEKFTNVIIQNNVISHNGLQTGAAINSYPSIGLGLTVKNCTYVYMKGNKIGVDITGNTKCGNVDNGIMFLSPCSYIFVGGSNASDKNIVGDNGGKRSAVWPYVQHGIQTLPGGTFSNFTFEGNNIGVGADGTTNVGNHNMGLGLWNITTLTIKNNNISNNVFGMFLDAINTGSVYGNTIAYNDDLTANEEGAGILVQDGSTNIQIGSPALAAAGINYINHNKDGIWLRKDGTASAPSNITIKNNVIEYNTGATGIRTDESSFGPTKTEANGGHGIAISGGSGTAGNNFIGGTGANEANIIDNNRLNGIFIYGMNKNWISGNSIYCNGNGFATSSDWNKGINLELSSSAPGNSGYATPTVYAVGSGSTASTLNGTATANSIVEIFGTESCVTCPAPPSAGVSIEGKTYKATVTADGSGNWTWSPAGGLAGSYTVTATEPSGTNRNTSEFSICGYITLPVEMVSFAGELVDGVVNLKWVTASEKDNAYFIVERSADGVHFQSIGEVKGNGDSRSTLTYLFVDNDPFEIVSYYRIKQVDIDGKVSTSNIISVNIGGNDSVEFYPNPATDHLNCNMSFVNNSSYTLNIYNVHGSQVLTVSGDASKGFYQKTLDVSQLALGVYFIELRTGVNVFSHKLIKQ